MTDRKSQLHVIMTPAEKQEMREAADSLGLDLSSWVRMTLLQAARGISEQTRGKIPPHRGLIRRNAKNT